jgi:hypothetical protein
MGLYENMPFARGATYFGMPGGAAVPTLDDTSAANLVGRDYIHMDNNYNTGTWVKVRVMRNDAGIALQPGRLVKVGPAPTAYSLGGSNIAGNIGVGSVIGYANVGSTGAAAPEKGYVVDEMLTYNVPPYDLFYVVVKGPTLIYTSLTAADFSDTNTIGVGDHLHVAAAATSQATTAGRVAVASFAGTVGSVIAGQIVNVVGRAMSSAQSTQTAYKLLVEAGYGVWK